MTNLPAEDCPRKCVASLGATALRRLSMTEPLPLARDERGFAGLSAKVQAEAKPLVIVVDDDEAVRLSICELLESVGIDSAAFGSTRELLEADVLHRPGCMILDVRMPGLSGLDFQSQLAAQGIPTSIIFLTGHGDIPTTVRAMRGGASDFLQKTAPKDEVVAAIHAALEREAGQHAARIRTHELSARFARLTPREREVLQYVVLGRMNKEIAAALGINERTVKLHRTAITTKVGVQSAAQLALLGREIGLFADGTTFP
jgi:FixJ family two-component response regulator